jgi:hypothetical protein
MRVLDDVHRFGNSIQETAKIQDADGLATELVEQSLR